MPQPQRSSGPSNVSVKVEADYALGGNVVPTYVAAQPCMHPTGFASLCSARERVMWNVGCSRALTGSGQAYTVVRGIGLHGEVGQERLYLVRLELGQMSSEISAVLISAT
jgi:hypothetical protein